MREKKPDGGPAWPLDAGQKYNEAIGRYIQRDWQPGMSLRDWWASTARTEDVRNWMYHRFGASDHYPLHMARYPYADAMLAAREAADDPR